MIGSIALAAFVGVFVVLQGGLNFRMSHQTSLASGVTMNNLVAFLAALLFLILSKAFPAWVPEIFRSRGEAFAFSWWYLLPGLFGFGIVAGIPYAISRMGALKVFVLLVAAQMVAGLVWDAWVSGTSVTLARVAGAVLATAGAVVASLDG